MPRIAYGVALALFGSLASGPVRAQGVAELARQIDSLGRVVAVQEAKIAGLSADVRRAVGQTGVVGLKLAGVRQVMSSDITFTFDGLVDLAGYNHNQWWGRCGWPQLALDAGKVTCDVTFIGGYDNTGFPLIVKGVPDDKASYVFRIQSRQGRGTSLPPAKCLCVERE